MRRFERGRAPAAPVPASTARTLDRDTRAYFESRFAHNFGDVRVHTDETAARAARAEGARAYTFGRDIVFGAGRYRPDTVAGRGLIAHELGHVVEQRITPPLIQRQDEKKPKSTEERIEEFQAGAPYIKRNQQVGNGFFDAIYLPGYFYLLSRVKFTFEAGWNKADADKWKNDWRNAVAEKWEKQNITLYCTKPGWESVKAQALLRIADVEDQVAVPGAEKNPEQHYDVEVRKMPKGQHLESKVLGPPRDTQGALTGPGWIYLDSSGLDEYVSSAGHRQRPAIHESAHIAGLSDTYKNNNMNMFPPYAARVEQETGTKVKIQDDERLTSRGEKMGVEDAVTFVEMIRKTTNMHQWSLYPPMPLPQKEYNDAVPFGKTIV